MGIDDIVRRLTFARPPRRAEERKAFFDRVRATYRIDAPEDYVRFLELYDGGQHDNSILCGCAPDTKFHFHDTGGVFVVGYAGNVDGYVLHSDGRAEIVNMFALDEVSESYPSFTALLGALVR